MEPSLSILRERLPDFRNQGTQQETDSITIRVPNLVIYAYLQIDVPCRLWVNSISSCVMDGSAVVAANRDFIFYIDQTETTLQNNSSWPGVSNYNQYGGHNRSFLGNQLIFPQGEFKVNRWCRKFLLFKYVDPHIVTINFRYDPE